MRNLGTSKGTSLHEKIKGGKNKVRKRQRRHGTEQRRHEEKGLSEAKKKTGGTQGKRSRREKGDRKDNRTEGPNDQ